MSDESSLVGPVYQFPKEYHSADNILDLNIHEQELEFSRDVKSSFSLSMNMGELAFWSRVSVYRGVSHAFQWAEELSKKFNLLNKYVEKVESAGGPSWIIRQEISFKAQSPSLLESFLWFYSLKKIHRRGEICFRGGGRIVMNRDEDKIYYSPVNN